MFAFNSTKKQSPIKVVSTHNMPLSKDLQHMNYTLQKDNHFEERLVTTQDNFIES